MGYRWGWALIRGVTCLTKIVSRKKQLTGGIFSPCILGFAPEFIETLLNAHTPTLRMFPPSHK